jgi:hypothetical protein
MMALVREQYDEHRVKIGMISHKEYIKEIIQDALWWVEQWYRYCPLAPVLDSIPDTKEMGFDLKLAKKDKDPDFSTPVAMKLSRILGMTPLELANLIADFIRSTGKLVERVEAHKLGFVNIWLKAETWAWILPVIHEATRAAACYRDSNWGRLFIRSEIDRS